MAGRGPSWREESGQGGGRGTPGRGGRGGGRFGTPPRHPGSGSRPSGRGAGTAPASSARGRGGSPYPGGGRGRGGRGVSSPSPPSQQQQYQQQRHSTPHRGYGPKASSWRGGRGASGSGYSPSGYGRGHSGSPGLQTGMGVGGGKVFGRGAEAVAFDRDKEKGLWKVGPPAGQRFSVAWLRGLSAFVAWKHQQQQRQKVRLSEPATPPPPPQANQPQQPAMAQEAAQGLKPAGMVSVEAGRQEADEVARPQVTAEALPYPVPDRPAVTVERLPPSSSGLESGGGSPARAEVQVQGQVADVPGSAAGAAAPGGVEAGASGSSGLEAAHSSGSRGSLSPASSCSSDLGWAAVLNAAAVAAAAAAPSPGHVSSLAAESSAGSAADLWLIPDDMPAPGETSSAASPARSASSGMGSGWSQEPPSPAGCRPWWPASEPALKLFEPVAVEEGVAAEPALQGEAVQLSIRLERMALTDREAQMLADWCCQEARGVAAVRKLWLFDNRLGDEGAAHVARILKAHPQMLEVHLSHNMLTLHGAMALLEALLVSGAVSEGLAAGSSSRRGGTSGGCNSPHGPEDVPAAASASAEAASAGPAAVGAPAEAGPKAHMGAVGADVAAPATAAAHDSGSPSPPLSTPASCRPLWLRLEWNRISLNGLVEVLEEQHARRGLVVDLPAAIRADAAPVLPELPPYVAAAAAAAPAPAASVPASRGSRNALQYLVDDCHVRLPWISCQYQLPSEAAVLKTARRGWAQRPPPPPPPATQQSPLSQELHLGQEKQPGKAALAGAEGTATPAFPPTTEGIATDIPVSSGPLLLFPDTSALLPMLGAGNDVSIPTFFTLDLLGQLAQQGRFGRELPPHEQVFLVVTDSVLKQLDGLKNDWAARPAIRRFLGQGLDAYGPAGADFLTVLGAHEGEGLVVEHDAAVAGSRSADVGTKGQRADHRIVEVALFFQREVLKQAEAPSNTAISGEGDLAASSSGASGGCEHVGEGGTEGTSDSGVGTLRAGSFPVLLLSGDNAQVQTARSHGLPAVRMADVATAQRRLQAALEEGQLLTASLLRACLGTAAVTGLAEKAAGRSLQAEFDEAVAALEAATDALAVSQAQLQAATAAAAFTDAGIGAATAEGAGDFAHHAAAALAAVRQALVPPPGGNDPQLLLPVLHARLAEWRGLVRSHQDPSRLHRWASRNAGGDSPSASALAPANGV